MHLFGKYIIIYIIFLIISYDQLKLINGCSIPIQSLVYLDIVSRINESFALRLSGGATNIENKVITIRLASVRRPPADELQCSALEKRQRNKLKAPHLGVGSVYRK